MSKAAALKKKAVEFEQKKDYTRALELYEQVIEASVEAKLEPDVALYNRVGDLLVREHRTVEAVHYYGKAVDIYADGGFLNNAIALCNKVLRHDPAQTAIHYKLGRVSAQKGLRGDAKKHFLIYAERMQRQGDLDESFRALKEFADLCPDQDDIRLMLAEQLIKSGRNAEAVEQLQVLHERLTGEGRAGDAGPIAARIRTIDPTAVPRAGGSGGGPKSSGGLVFLDLDGPSTPAAAPHVTMAAAAPPPAPMAAPPVAPAPMPGLEPTMLSGELMLEPPMSDSALAPSAGGNVDLPMLDVGSTFPGPNGPSGAGGVAEDAPGGGPDLVFLTTGDDQAAGGAAAPLDLDLIGPATGAAALGGPAKLPDVLAVGGDDTGPMVFAEFQQQEAEEEEVVELPPLPPEEVPLPPPARDEIDEIALFGDPAPATGSPSSAPLPRPPVRPRPPAAPPAAAAAASNGADGAGSFVNLGDWLRDSEGPKSTRMVVSATEPGEGEEFDFNDMLRQFKQAVAENMDDGDHESHYDLGVAFKEMGLVDEAIAEFQKALRGTDHRAKAYEALGQCFIEKSQYQVAATVLARALTEPNMNDDHALVGVLYLLGTANEALGKRDEAIAYYQRVFAVEIQFRDVGDRLTALERSTR